MMYLNGCESLRRLCIPHGLKLRRQVPPVLASRIDTIIENYRQQLAQELKHLRD